MLPLTKDDLYENTYNKGRHFSFGENWNSFLDSVFSKNRLEIAKKSLIEFLDGIERIRGRTFVDVGCGSGIFSLAAFLLGAKEVVSIDIDKNSIACVNRLWESAQCPHNWKILQGSALNKEFIQSLGKFDIVYSWGVLHHTGNMYEALDTVSSLMKPHGVFYLAIYNNCRIWWIGTSSFWLKVKRRYNHSGVMGKKLIFFGYVLYFFFDSFISLKNPFKRISSFRRRGMNWRHNIIDWIGGYPYEYASPSEIVNHFSSKGVFCTKITDVYGLACVEYLLHKEN